MINVIGLGYIGLPTALMMAAHGVEVIGTDYNKELVDTLNAGHTTFKEDGLDELFQNALKAGIKFTTEYQKTDMYIAVSYTHLPYPGVATGLGIAVEPGHPIYKAVLSYYENIHFEGASGGLTVVEHVTSVLIEHGLKPTRDLQVVKGITIYPPEYFCPFDKFNRIAITPKTVAIHH